MDVCRIAPPPKPGEEWGRLEQSRYDITFKRQTLVEFFGVQVLPDIPQSVNDICAVEDKDATTDDATYHTLCLMDLAQRPIMGSYAVIDLFIADLLQRMGFAEGGRSVLLGHKWPFTMAGQRTFALTDICIIDEQKLPVLLAKTDKRMPRCVLNDDLEMPLVAAAIAAFDRHNDYRCQASLPKFDEMIFPAIAVINNTLPTFYKICISQQFRDVVASVQMGQSTSTIVYCDYPQFDFRYRSDGMMRLDTRHIFLRHMEAFRQFIVSEEMVSVNFLPSIFFFENTLSFIFPAEHAMMLGQE